MGEDVHFDEPDGFDGVHVEMGGGIAFGGDETRGDFVQGLAREDQAAGMHFGIARETVEESRHLERSRVRLLVEGQIAAFERVDGNIGQLTRPGKMGKTLGKATDFEFRDAEDFGNFGKGAAGLERGKAPNHRGVGWAVLFEN